MDIAQPVRVRFAPSPTGFFHVGGARTALFDWLYARHHNGKFILRIEDTDRTRYNPGAVPDLLESLRWLGLFWDEGPEVGGQYGPYYQSDRLHLYHQYTDQLVANGQAYRCYCSPERLEALREEQRAAKLSPGYDRQCRYLTQKQISDFESQGIKPVVRLAVPLEGVTVVDDLLRGRIEFDNRQLDDLVLLKSDGFPTYHLGVVIDDHLMEINPITRGEEWLSSAPKHVLLYQALGWKMPVVAHLPTILDPSGHGKLSKRKKKSEDGVDHLIYVREFREAGYLPEAMFNFLATVGWSYDDKTEFLYRDEFIRHFDLHKVSRSAAAFSYEKLDHINATFIRSLGANDLAGRLQRVMLHVGIQADFATMLALVPLVRERLETLEDITTLVDFVFQEITYPPELLIQDKMDRVGALAVLANAEQVLQGLSDYTEGSLEQALRTEVERLGLKAKQYFGCLRVACTGRAVSPPLMGLMSIMGREKVLSRIRTAHTLLAAL
jgi:glutamyl-tRNA synthetase